MVCFGGVFFDSLIPMTAAKFLLLFLGIILAFAGPVRAQDLEAMKKNLDARTDAMLKGLDQNQMKQFDMIRHAHGTVRAVTHVDRTITDAMNACAARNPDMHEKIVKRGLEWNEALAPTLRDAAARLKEMIALQNFTRPSVLREYLAYYDRVVSKGEVKTIPIHEKSECRGLLNTMDDRQEDLVRLMRKTLNLDRPLNKVSP